MALAPTLSALWRRGLPSFSEYPPPCFGFVLRLLRGTVDICKEANGCSSHAGGRAAFSCLDVNIWNATPDRGSEWVSSDTNRTVNPFSFLLLRGCVCACANRRDMPLPCCEFVYFIADTQGAPATVLKRRRCPQSSSLASYRGSLRCDTKLLSLPLITLHLCLHHSCMKLAIRWFPGTDRETRHSNGRARRAWWNSQKWWTRPRPTVQERIDLSAHAHRENIRVL